MSELAIEGKLMEKLKVIEKKATNSYSTTFRKMEFIVETDDQFPQLIKMVVTQEKIPLVQDLPTGTVARFHFNIKGRKWISDKDETVYFNSISVWRVEVMSVDFNKIPEARVETETAEEDLKDLPF